MRRACILPLVLLVVTFGALRSFAAPPPHTFEYRPPDGVARPNTVHVAGDFNGWSNVATPMADAGDGTFRANVTLPEGVHLYKFVVNGNEWIPDPKGDPELEAPDNFGCKNSGVLVGPDARKAPPANPNHIDPTYVIHDPADPADADNLGDGRVRVRLRVLANDLTGATVSGANGGESHRLWKSASKNGFDVYNGVVGTSGKPALKKYFMHGVGHPLGLDVHDVSNIGTPFAAGWVMTVEPGIYLPKEGFGVRLENDVLITTDGVVDLMEDIPVEAAEIESLMNH